MEQEATGADQQVSNKGDGEYGIVAMFATIEDTFEGKEDEHEICQSIDDLCRVRSGIVVLRTCQLATLHPAAG